MAAARQISTIDFLYLQFRALNVNLIEVAKVYFPHLNPQELRRRANAQKFGFAVFKLDDSKQAPFFVHLSDLAEWLDQNHNTAAKDHANSHL